MHIRKAPPVMPERLESIENSRSGRKTAGSPGLRARLAWSPWRVVVMTIQLAWIGLGCSPVLVALPAHARVVTAQATTAQAAPTDDSKTVVKEASLPMVVFYPPMGLPGLHTLEEGRPVGFYPDLIAALARAGGFRADLRSVVWPAPLEAVRFGGGDVLGPVMGRPASFGDLMHTAPLMRVEWARYVRVGESRSTNAIMFKGVRVAAISDSVGTQWMSREHPSAIQVPVQSIKEGIDALITGKADALLTLKLPTRQLIRAEMEGRIEEVGTELTAPMTLAVAPRSLEVLPALNAAIEILTANGELERLRNRWMPPAPRSGAEISERRMAMMLAGLVGILLLLSGVLWAANRRLTRARHQAEEARQAKSNFLAVISHEIRTPINGLVNLIDLLQRSGPNPEQTDLLNKAEQANRSLLGLVNQVLDFSKIEASRMEIVARPMRLGHLMERVEGVLASQPRAEGVVLRFSAIPRDWPNVQADEERLAQVLINLGGNALKFTRLGQVQVLVSRLHPSMDAQSRLRLRLEVQDTGPGIEPEEIKRLFQPFVQLKEGLSRPHAGTGLGLSTSAELVRQMGSHLEVSSTPGHLTRFWFDLNLPIHEGPSPSGDETASASAPPTGTPAMHLRLRDVRVMVVDDNPLNLLVTRKILEQEGCAVTQAAGAQEALDALGDEALPRPDIILMDLHMPQVDGLEATRRLREALGPDLPPVLAVSGAVTDDARDAARAVGMSGFVPKPFERATLLQAIEAHLREPA